MNKKQRNRKVVTQNRRNRMINRRYSSTIRSLSKLFGLKVSILKTADAETSSQIKSEALNLVKSLYSIIDKAVKKGVLHKNAAARKKSTIGLISNNL